MKQSFSQIDQLIRQGKGQVARLELQRINKSKLERHDLVAVTNFYRRVGLNHHGLKILNPIIRPSAAKISKPTQEELTEYGVLLINIGVFYEGMSILDQVDIQQIPNALLFKAFGFFNQWDYASAIPLLETFIQSHSINEYQKHIGILNLLAAYVETQRFDLFDQNFAELFKYLSNNKYNLLLGNLFEIQSQRYFFEGHLTEARKSLHDSAEYLKEAESFSLFLIKKWNYIFNLDHSKKHNSSEYLELCAEATKDGYAEGIRDMDLYRYLKFNDSAGLNYLYWGTPYLHYRNKIKNLSLQQFQTPEFNFLPELKENFQGSEFDPLKNQFLQDNPLLLKMIYALNHDFYRNLKVPEIYSLIYPENFYNPFTSPEAIKQLILRLRKFLISQKLPYNVTANHGSWELQLKTRLKNENRVGLHFSFHNRTNTNIEKNLLFQKLKLFKLAARKYSYGELRREALLCDTTFGRELAKATEWGLLIKSSEGHTSRYRINQSIFSTFI